MYGCLCVSANRREKWLWGMLRAKRKRWGNLIIFDRDIQIAEIRGTGDLTIGSSPYKISSDGWPLKGYDLEHHGKIVATADQSVFKGFPGIVIQYGRTRYQLRPEYVSWWRFVIRRPFILQHGDKQIGSVRPKSRFSKEAIIDLPENVPIFVRIFIFWIVNLLWEAEIEAGKDNIRAGRI